VDSNNQLGRCGPKTPAMDVLGASLGAAKGWAGNKEVCWVEAQHILRSRCKCKGSWEGCKPIHYKKSALRDNKDRSRPVSHMGSLGAVNSVLVLHESEKELGSGEDVRG
jgi:hypothetical protein